MKRMHFYQLLQIGKHSLFCCLLLVSIFVSFQNSQSQPQTPIVWGEVHLLRSEPLTPIEMYEATEIAALGDTVLITLDRESSNGRIAQVALSGNNGETWSPWHVLADTSFHNHSGGKVTTAFVSDAILVCGGLQPERNGFHRTEDLGMSWTPPDTSIPVLRIHDQIGDTVFCTSLADFVLWTADGGQTFSPLRELDLNIWSSSISMLSVSQNWLHVVARGRTSQASRIQTYYARAPLLDGPFQDIRVINPDFYWSTTAYLEFTEDGTGIMLGTYDLDSPAPLTCTVMLNSTRDDGNSWSSADTVSAVQAAGFQTEGLAQNDHMWLAYWSDTLTYQGFSQPGAKIRFSANHGRSWYPVQQVEDADWSLGSISEGTIQSNRAAIYVSCHEFENSEGVFWLQWEGLISADSIAPQISEAREFPLLVTPDTLLQPSLSASDNDSMWLVQFVAFRNTGDTIVIPLERTGETEFSTQWQVPSDTALWHYYYHAEDMWENITYIPEGGPADPFELHVGEIQPADEYVPHPSTLDLSIYPNPGNSEFTISGNYLPGIGPEAVVIYDLLGREVTRLAIPPGTVDRFTLHWNATNYANQPLGSGVYFVVPESGGVYTTYRIILIR